MKTLIVEDNADDRRILRYNLERHGCGEVIEARDGEEALEMARLHHPDLIVSDALMPRMDGFQFLRHLRREETLRDIPFVFYSAVYTGYKEAELAISIGADAFIVKPKEPEEFWDELQTVLEGCKIRRKPAPREAGLIEPGEEEKYLRKYSIIVATKLEEEVMELEKALALREQAEREIRSSEERLRDSEDRLRLAIESTGLGTFDYCPLTGETIWSDLTKRHFGLPPDAKVDYGVFLAGLHPDDRDRVERLAEETFRPQGSGEFSTEYRTIGIQDGKERWIAARGRVYLDATGQPVRLIGTTRDITGQKEAEKKIEVLNTHLAARASELEAANQELEAFSYSVTHDLRKPLTIINGYCQVIEQLCGDTLDEECKKYLAEIYNGTLRMNQLIDALLKFSVLTRGELRQEMVDLSDMAKTVAAELRRTETERQVTFRITEGITGNGDRSLLQVVMENLLGNAWKYTGKQSEAVIEFGVRVVEGKQIYFVRDNGTGFDMAYAKQLFVPFQRLPGTDEFKGHGIGLATVARIISRHGGKVWAEGEPGKGATFYFALGRESNHD